MERLREDRHVAGVGASEINWRPLRGRLVRMILAQSVHPY